VQRAEWDFVLEIVFRTRFKKQMPFDYAQGGLSGLKALGVTIWREQLWVTVV